MVTNPPNPEELQQQMRSIRSDLGVEVHDLVQNARDLTDWHVYVRRYPWACVAAAAAVGYLVVPQSRKQVVPDAESLLQLAKDHKIVVEAPAAPTGGIVSKAAGLVMGIAVRAGLNALGRKLGPMLDDFPKASAVPSHEGDDFHDQSH